MARGSTKSTKNDRNAAGYLPRKLAVDWLFDITHRQRSLDDVLLEAEQNADWQALSPRDRGFARALIMEALRRKGDVDWLLLQFLEKSPPRKSRAYEILSLGCVQMLFLDVAPHAAIDMAVRLAKSSNHSRHLAKLVNAVLRRISEKGPGLLAANPDPLRNIADTFRHSWQQHYGEATLRQMAAVFLKAPPLDLVVKDDPKLLLEQLSQAQHQAFCLFDGAVVRVNAKGCVRSLPGFHEGAWFVQNFSAHLPTCLFGDLAGKRVLDLCAAPGGKTAALALKGAQVTAVDISEKRMARVQETLDRLGLKAELVVADVLSYTPEEPFDAVLLDAPCSATGTVRRHPDVLLLKTREQIKQLADIQAHMLQRVKDFVRPQGTVVYCTCSLEDEEGEAQMTRFLETTPQAQRLPFRADEVFQHSDWLTEAGDLRLLPSYSPFSPQDQPELKDLSEPEVADFMGLDGFFISRFTVT